MAEAFVEVLLQNLSSFIRKELGLLYGVDEELRKLASSLSTIKAVIQDADDERLKEKAIRNWLQKLNNATYEVDDVLDECAAATAIRFQEKSRKIGCISLPSVFPLENLLFRRQMGQKVKDAIRKLDGIAEERIKFHLSEVTSKKRVSTTEEVRETGFVLTPAEVYGRDDDEGKIIEILTKHVDGDFRELLVLPIVGMGGLGKTTLAQLIFNDAWVHEHFDLKIWVCVSYNFDEKRLIRAILEAIVGKDINASELASLQRHLITLLRGKRYLLVLDDVWNEDEEKWDKLKALLAFGSRGTSVITTTRLDKVASIMGTVCPYHLSCLSEHDCWLLFKQRAFGLDRKESPKLVDIGKEIVRRCCGVPLAAKALGSLLRFKSDEKEWLFVRDSDFWNLPQDESTSILPALRLSYFHLPQDLRNCFAYCAIFEKGSKIDKEELIYFWMANGFISSEGNLEPEDRGNQVWNELYWRSLFQEVQQNSDGRMLFKIHDLVHDLAQSITDHDGVLEGGGKISTTRIRHATIHAENKSFLAFPKSTIPYNPSTITTYGSLRVLIFCSVQLTELPPAIGNLIHLRYLDLFSTCIESLPRSICSLRNLQILSVEDCCLLRVLPKHLRYLRNLRHLRLRGCPLSHIPPSIGQLTHLKTLNKFVVGKRRCSKVSELRDLNLQGELVIEHLERVQNHMEAKEALSSKQNLVSLALYWNHSAVCESSKDVVDLQVLEALEPHSNLKHLKVSGFRSTHLASWMSDSALRSIVTLYLHDCKYCLHLPKLAQLPCLKSLSLRGNIHLEYIDSDVECRISPIRKFPSLESLEMWNLSNLKGFSINEGEEQFPCLREIWIENCPLLTFPSLLSVRKLRNTKCSNLTLASISNLCSLTCLDIAHNKELTYFPEDVLTNLTDLEILSILDFTKLEVLPNSLESLTALKSLRIGYCNQLKSIPEPRLSINRSDGLKYQGLASLEDLEILECPELASFLHDIKHLNSLRRVHLDGLPMLRSREEDTVIHPEELVSWQLPEALQRAHNLQSLSVRRFPTLTLLPGWLGELTSLKELNIVECDNLASLPECLERMNLESLNILGCRILEKRCRPGQGEDWYKIAHIPKVKITQNSYFFGINLSLEMFINLRQFHL